MDKLYYSKFNIFLKINQAISNFYIYHKYMTYHIYYSIFLMKLHLYFYLLFTQNIVIVELLSAYFAFVEDDHSSTLAAAISLL